MSKASPTRFRVTTGGPDHLAYLAEVAAELAILRVPGLSPHKPPKGDSYALFDMVATSDKGVCFLVKIQSYSAFKLKIEPDLIPVLELDVDAEYIKTARRSPTPVVMFLFDGDRGHGRHLRLDTLSEPSKSAKTVVLSFPVENAITGESIHALADEIAKERLVPASA